MSFLLSFYMRYEKFSGSLAITCLKLRKETVVFELAHEREIDEIRRLHVGEPRILHCQQPLHVLEPFDRGERPRIEFIDGIGISFLGYGKIIELETVHDRLD